MELILIGEFTELFERLGDTHTTDFESLLLALEEALESGELELHEAIEILKDHYSS